MLFTLEDAIEEVSEKMIRRHPHIFGTAEADSPEQVLENWEEIKKKEKEGKSWIESPLREIPKELPSLTRGPKVLKKIDKLYEAAPVREETAEKLLETVKELAACGEETEKGRTEKLLGDALLGLCEIARREKIPAEQVLMDRIEELIEEKEGKISSISRTIPMEGFPCRNTSCRCPQRVSAWQSQSSLSYRLHVLIRFSRNTLSLD